MFLYEQVHFPVLACPHCGTQMHPDLTEALPNGINRTMFACDDCGAETVRVFGAAPAKTDADFGVLGLAPAQS